MKKYILPALLSASLYAAPSGFYIEANGGKGWGEKLETTPSYYMYERGFVGSAALGFQIDSFRLELEGEYKANKIISYSTSNQSASGDLIRESQMCNIYYSGYNESQLVTTIGIGAGSSDIKRKDVTIQNVAQSDIDVKNIFTYQGMVSIGYMVNKHLTFQIKYKYLATAKHEDLKESGEGIMSAGFRVLF